MIYINIFINIFININYIYIIIKFIKLYQKMLNIFATSFSNSLFSILSINSKYKFRNYFEDYILKDILIFFNYLFENDFMKNVIKM